MRIVVYTGTSISHTDAKKILEAEYLPPVKRNDIRGLMKNFKKVLSKEGVLLRNTPMRPQGAQPLMKNFKKVLSKEGVLLRNTPMRPQGAQPLMKSLPEIIGIIDGGFFDSAAVAHREIIEALNKGIKVVGGGSMGALRASELDSYGMIGVGRIYEMYKSGAIESDDEVAVTFNSETLEPLSIPLVNIRMTVQAAQDAGVLTQEQAAAMVEAARKMFYPDRNYQRIIRASVEKGIIAAEEENLLDFFRKHGVDIKRQDAVLVLEKIKELSL